MPKGFAVRAKISKKSAARAKEVRGRALNLKPAMRLIGRRMLRSTARNFERQGRNLGMTGAWPALSPVTIAIRESFGALAFPILDDTGRMKNSVVFNDMAQAVEWGTNVEYAGNHQQGGIWGAEKIVTSDIKFPAHDVPEHAVRAHTRKTKSGKIAKVKAHRRGPFHREIRFERRTLKIPARPFLLMHADDRAFADRTVSGFIDGGSKGAASAAKGGAA